jgi:type II pantothenate kinase
MPVLCQLADPENYCAFDWVDFQDNRDREYWFGLFTSFPTQIEKHLRDDGWGGDEFETKWKEFCDVYSRRMSQARARFKQLQRQSTIELGRIRQGVMDEFGWSDPYHSTKQRENELASGFYPDIVHQLDQMAETDRWLALLKGLFAGNMFDLGCPETIELYHQGKIDFKKILLQIPERPWFIDEADALLERVLPEPAWKQILLFVDNAGSDIVLGVLPVARELASKGVRVVLAANSSPALNDITIEELDALLTQLANKDQTLAQLIQADRLTTVASGSGSPLIDLSCVSEECNAAAAQSDLVVLEGMGRGVESNWRQKFLCDIWRVALVKDRSVAGWLNAPLFSPVCRFDPAGA